MHRLFSVLLLITATTTFAQEVDTSAGDQMIADYFRSETRKLQKSLHDIRTLEEWTSRREEYRQQLLEMLGLNPLPEKSDLNVRITGTTEHDDFIVQRLHYQSRPGLYVTGNLYVPKNVREKLPAILYVCGHGAVRKDGVSYGNKVHYHHHGSWFARNGYVCLTIDTLQLGEIEGIHHGTYREKMWWWLNRGYTPAGVEAWNCVRALDYLQSRPEVDGDRLGVTGRSGGGAYSWWIAAIDERIKCAVPVAGITDLQNYVFDGHNDRFADGCVEGHCDCMFMFNTHRWDYPMVAAMVAPRPLLISNTDADLIFPLDGVYRTYEEARHIYKLYGKPELAGLNVTQGGHSDTQELRVSAFTWFERHLKQKKGPITKTADKFFEPEQLKVFSELPDDEQNTQIHETFVAAAPPPAPIESGDQWAEQRDRLLSLLKNKTFAGWPQKDEPLDVREAFRIEKRGIVLRALDFTSQGVVRLRVYVAHKKDIRRAELVVLNPVDENGWRDFVETMSPVFGDALPQTDKAREEEFETVHKMLTGLDWAMAWVAPRGIGETRWNQAEKKQTQHRRRFYLLGQSLDGQRVLDIRRAMQTIRADNELRGVPLWLQAHGSMATMAAYASLFEPPVARLDLHDLRASHREGPYLLNVRKFMDVPEALALAADRARVVVYDNEKEQWSYPSAIAKAIGKQRNFSVRAAVQKRPK